MLENPYSAPNYGEVPEPKRGPGAVVTVVAVVIVALLLIALVFPARRSGSSSGRLMLCRNNLSHIALALHQYEREHGALPPAYTVDADGKPLHSWRTLILPYMEEATLYKKIDLMKAWDDPANAEAFKTIVPAYQCPSTHYSTVCPETHTTYLASVTPSGCFHPTKPRPFSEIADGLSKTLMVIEVPQEHAVHWMSPVDAREPLVMGVSPESKLAHPGGVNAALCDGSVQFLSDEMPADERRAMITITGGD